MDYRYSLTVPAGTLQSTPARKVMRVGRGILQTIEIGFPPGCAGLVHVYVSHWEQQLWPWNTDEGWAWDDYNIVLRNINFGVSTPPYLFHLCGWSEDDTYSHRICCRLGIRRPELHRPGSWVARLLRGESAQ